MDCIFHTFTKREEVACTRKVVSIDVPVDEMLSDRKAGLVLSQNYLQQFASKDKSRQLTYEVVVKRLNPNGPPEHDSKPAKGKADKTSKPAKSTRPSKPNSAKSSENLNPTQDPVPTNIPSLIDL